MSSPSVATIVVNYRVAELALEAIRSLLDQQDEANGYVYLIDNASPDNSLEVLRPAMAIEPFAGRVRLIESSKNGGFGAGNNIAIRDALSQDQPPDYIYLLNPDAFLFPGALSGLLDFMESNKQAGIAASFLETDDVVWSPGFRYPNVLDQFEQGLRLGVISRMLSNHLQRMPMPSEPTEVDWVGGPSFIIRREVIESIGAFDEQFFLYFEETDLCLRARNAGFPSYIVPDSVVHHIEQASTKLNGSQKRRPRYWFDSRKYYFEKNHGRIYRHAADFAWLTGLLGYRLRCALQRRENPDPPNLIIDFVRYNLGLLQ